MTKTTHSHRPVKSKPSRRLSEPERHCRLSPGQGPGSRRILTLYVGAEAFLYWLRGIPGDWGQGFELEKFAGGETYHVHLGPDSCECLGWLRWGHLHPCKHLSAIKALRTAGRL